MTLENAAGDAATTVEVTQQQSPEGEKQVDNTEDLTGLRSKLAEQEKLIEKLRRHEKESLKKEQDALTRANELEGKWRDRLVNGALEAALGDAINLKTALKLVDKSAIKVDGDAVDAESIKTLVEALRTESPELFKTPVEDKKEPQAPSVKRAGEGDPIGGYEKEIRAAKTAKEVEAVLRKYGKM
jgi:hypothetical protein